MNKEQAQQEAIAMSRYVAIVVSTDGGVSWTPHTHPEARYLSTLFPFGAEIWIFDQTSESPEWVCYQGKGTTPDLVAETGATGEYADILGAMMQLMDDDD